MHATGYFSWDDLLGRKALTGKGVAAERDSRQRVECSGGSSVGGGWNPFKQAAKAKLPQEEGTGEVVAAGKQDRPIGMGCAPHSRGNENETVAASLEGERLELL